MGYGALELSVRIRTGRKQGRNTGKPTTPRDKIMFGVTHSNARRHATELRAIYYTFGCHEQ
jgi:hypothetical protein